MIREVEAVTVYAKAGDTLRPIANRVTHYRFPWRGHFVGEGLRHELEAAGLPPEVMVTAREDGDSWEVSVSFPGDDGGKMQSKIDRAVDKHKGSEAPDHKALVEFSGSIREVAQRMAEGRDVSQKERDIVTGILAGRLV